MRPRTLTRYRGQVLGRRCPGVDTVVELACNGPTDGSVERQGSGAALVSGAPQYSRSEAAQGRSNELPPTSAREPAKWGEASTR
jgi:hypothetical protein